MSISIIRPKNQIGKPSGNKVFGLTTFGEIIADKENSAVSWLVDGIFQAKAPVLIHAPSKCCKTTLAADLAVACATGGQWLGANVLKTRVAFISVEDGLAGLTQTVRLICKSRGVELPTDTLHIGAQIEDISDPAVMASLADFLRENQVGLAVFDPAYLLLGEYQHSQMSDAGGKLYRLSEVCRSAGATCVVLHHSKSTGTGLGAAAGAGFAQWPSSWLTITRIGSYKLDGKHQLKLEYGGRTGQQGTLRLSIDEGLTDGRVTQCAFTVARMERQHMLFETDTAQATGKRKRVSPGTVLSELTSTPQSQSAIWAKTGGAKHTVKQYLDTLVETGSASESNGKYSLAG
jgi:hypothetical protein